MHLINARHMQHIKPRSRSSGHSSKLACNCIRHRQVVGTLQKDRFRLFQLPVIFLLSVLSQLTSPTRNTMNA